MMKIKSKTVGIRLNETEEIQLKDKAGGKPLGRYLKQVAIALIDDKRPLPMTSSDPEAIRHIIHAKQTLAACLVEQRRIGKNINQIARALNILVLDRVHQSPDDLVQALEGLQEQLARITDDLQRVKF